MTDKLDCETLDPGIRRVVQVLRTHHFQTTDSGDGVTKCDPKSPTYMECAINVPHVFMTVDPTVLVTSALRLHRVITALGVVLNSEIRIEASYDPADDSAMLMLFGLTDDMLPEAKS